MPDFIQPTTVTDSNNNELTAKRTPQGWIISNGSGVDILTIGYQKDGKIGLLFNDTNTDRLFLGMDENNTPFGKLSQEGVNVLTATEQQTIWNIENNNFKIIKTATVEYEPTLGPGVFTTSKDIPHGLGFAPIPMVFLESPTNYFTPLPNAGAFGVDSAGGAVLLNNWLYATTNEDFLFINCISSIDNNTWGPYNFRYYLLQETSAV